MEFTTLPAVLATIAKGIDATNIDEKLKQTGGRLIRSGKHANASITQTLKYLIVTPTIIPSSSLKLDENIDNVIKVCVDMFASYYLQAFNWHAKVIDVETMKSLKDLSSHIDLSSDIYIPSADLNNVFSIKGIEASLEESRLNKLSKDNLASGVILEVTVRTESSITVKDKDGNEKTESRPKEIRIPIVIRPNIRYTDFETMKYVIGVSDKKTSLKSRWMQWRSGEITFWKDFVFAMDLIKEQKKQMMKGDNVYMDIVANANKAVGRYLTSGRKSFGSLYNIAIIDEQEEKDLEYELGGSLIKPRIIKELFKSNKLLMLCVLNRELERLIIYTRDLDGYTDVSLKSIKKSDSVNILDALKSFSNNTQPIL